jgi:uncharacterized protein YjiS (DUF1127 family)
MTTVTHYGTAADWSMAALWPTVVRAVDETISTMMTWYARARQRAELAELADWQLRDVGLSREQAIDESATRFWPA